MNENQKKIFDILMKQGAFAIPDNTSSEDIKIALGGLLGSCLYSWNLEKDLDVLNQDMIDISEVAFSAIKLFKSCKI